MGFIAELKRRNVFRVGVAYLVLGWVVIQVTDIVSPALNLPDWTLPMVTWFGVIGFPFALLFAWAFELTPEGIKREHEVDRTQSIAVLPFTDMSAGQDQEYFSDGIAEELLNALTKLKNLRVAARTSSFAFKGRQQDITEIGCSLPVFCLNIPHIRPRPIGTCSGLDHMGNVGVSPLQARQ